MVDLPVMQLTDTVGYVTSPGFDGLHLFYSSNYDGGFHLHVSDESVLISFTHFALTTVILTPLCMYNAPNDALSANKIRIP